MAQRLFLQLLDAVAHCHAMKVCHRDLKLENFVLDKNQASGCTHRRTAAAMWRHACNRASCEPVAIPAHSLQLHTACNRARAVDAQAHRLWAERCVGRGPDAIQVVRHAVLHCARDHRWEALPRPAGGRLVARRLSEHDAHWRATLPGGCNHTYVLEAATIRAGGCNPSTMLKGLLRFRIHSVRMARIRHAYRMCMCTACAPHVLTTCRPSVQVSSTGRYYAARSSFPSGFPRKPLT